MGKELNIICTICARGGSKGVPGKNTRLLNNKPLLAHSIEQAKSSGLFSAIAVSSDSDEILRVAQEFGADYIIKRPDSMASDKAAKLPVIRHCVQEIEKQVNREFDICVDLDCTSPLRLAEDIQQSIKMLLDNQCDNIITGAPSRRSPYFNLVEINKDGFVELSKKLSTQVVRRQDAPKTFDLNASIYVWKRDSLINNDNLFGNTMIYEMPEERSIDIDSELDFQIVSQLMESRK